MMEPSGPAPIQRASPSLLEALRSCGLRVSFYRHGTGPRPSSPSARLGMACHEVLEAAASGGLGEGDFEAAFEQAWGIAIARQAAEAGHFAAERRWGPPTRWYSFDETKARLRRLCRRLRAEAAEWVDGDVLVEAWLEPDGTRIHGRPDLIVRAPRPHRVIDFKSGAVLEDGAKGLKQAYRRQILLYAHLEELASGSLPEEAFVVPLKGPDERVEVTVEAVAEEVRQAEAIIDRYNAALSEPSQLATPGSEVCSRCPYAITCDPFWTWLDLGPDTTDLLAIKGEVSAIQPVGDRMLSLILRDVTGTMTAESVAVERIPNERFPELAALNVGQRLRVVAGRVRSTDPARITVTSQTQLG